MFFIKTAYWCSFLFLLLFTCSCILYKTRPKKLYRTVVRNKEVFDVAIVPGVPFKNGKWGSVMKGRVLWAHFLYRKGIIRNIIFSGSAVYSPYCEAIIMCLYAKQLGIPSAHIFCDIKAEHSTENIFYAYEIARQQGFKSIALVTDPFQSSLLKRFTRKRFTTKISHIPFMIDSIKKYSFLEPIINSSSAYKENFTSIVKRQNYWQRLRGTLGAFIPWKGDRKKEAPL